MKQHLIALYENLRLASRPHHWSVLWRDRQETRPSTFSDDEHLAAAISWLCRAQDVVAGGVSAGYFFKRGWMPPYPETTGYIIPTLLAVDQTDRAIALGEWEIEIQLPSGGVRGGIGLNDYPIVFNTGQVILGWTALYRATAEEKFLTAAVRAADWLLDVQDPDGKWTRHTYLDAPRAYHTRVAWPLLKIHVETGEKSYRAAAERFLQWLKIQRLPAGGFAHMALEPGQVPITHTIAYTLRGLLECGLALGPPSQDELIDLVSSDVRQLITAQQAQLQAPPARLPAALDENWRGRARHSCLPGNAQLAILLLKLHALAPAQTADLVHAAQTLIEQVKAGQFLTDKKTSLFGGVAASAPIGGAYVPYALPNWGAKFLADALLLKRTLPA